MAYVPAGSLRHPYGAKELKQVYRKNLLFGLGVSVFFHLVFVGLIWNFVDSPPVDSRLRTARIFKYEEIKSPDAMGDVPFGLSYTPVLPSLPEAPPSELGRMAARASTPANRPQIAPQRRTGIGVADLEPMTSAEKIQPAEETTLSDLPGNRKVQDERTGLPGGGSGNTQIRGGTPIASLSGDSPDGFDRSGVGSSRKISVGEGGVGTNGDSDSGDGIGYSMSWSQGRPRRKVSGSLPAYPSGVNVESAIVLLATVEPAGGVRSIQPARKGERRLEEAAMKEVAFWRFEPLPNSVPQVTQTCQITFLFKLQ